MSETLTREQFEERCSTISRAGVPFNEWQQANADILLHDAALRTQVRAQLAQLAAVTAEREKALNDVYIPGNWFCPQCQFAQSITNLYVNSGTFGPNTDQVPLCPNDGTLMKRERWQDQVMSFDKALTKKMDECDALQRQLAEANARIAELERRAKLSLGTVPCGGCGGPHRFDTTVPSVVWNHVVRESGMSEYLCLNCVVKAFAQVNQSFTAELVGDDLNFIPIEIRVRGQVAEDARAISEENTTLRARTHELEAALHMSKKNETGLNGMLHLAKKALARPCPQCKYEQKVVRSNDEAALKAKETG